MFICMPKVKFITHFILEILHLKEPCNFIGWQHLSQTGDPEFCQIWVDVKISLKILVFTLDYFREKLMATFLKKSKKPILGPCGHFGLFLSKFRQKWISLENRLSQFLNSNYLPSCQKSEKTNRPFLRKMMNWRMNGQTDRMTDRKPWFCRTLCRTGIQLLN